jgi:hypothetical protein
MRRIDVTIDRVVLRGLEPADRHGFVDGLKTGLSLVLADHAGLKAAGSRPMPVLRLGRMAIEPGASGSRKFASGVARGIAGGFKR